MKKKTVIQVLLSLCVIAGLVSGTYFIFFGWSIPLHIFPGILCYLASVSIAVFLCLYRKGITGKRLTGTGIAAAILGIPLVIFTAITILELCGASTILFPKAMPSINWYTEFSFEEDMQMIDPDSPLVKTEGFVNVDGSEEELSFYGSVPYERAKLELGEDSSSITSYSRAYDKTEDIWRVQFYRHDTDSYYTIPFATVYLNGSGVTRLVVYEE